MPIEMPADLITQSQYVAAVLFAIGLAIVIAKRNVFFLLMGIEVMLNAVNLSYVSFARSLPAELGVHGQIAPLFVIALAAAEASIGLAMVIVLVRGRNTLDSDEFADLRE